jgi:hypothetical protein
MVFVLVLVLVLMPMLVLMLICDVTGGITNGLDMVAAYLREKYPGPLSDTVCMLADVGDRGQEYRTGKVVSNGLWLWAIVRAWWVGK